MDSKATILHRDAEPMNPATGNRTRFQLLHRLPGAAAGVIGLGFGLFLVYQIGFVDGLFR